MRALVPDGAPVQHQDSVCPYHRRQAVGDDQGREPLHEVLESVLHQRFALRVEAARRLIQDQDLGALQDDPSDGHALALAGAEGNAALTHHGLLRAQALPWRHGSVLLSIGSMNGWVICWVLWG